MNDGLWLRLHEERAARLQAEAREPRAEPRSRGRWQRGGRRWPRQAVHPLLGDDRDPDQLHAGARVEQPLPPRRGPSPDSGGRRCRR